MDEMMDVSFVAFIDDIITIIEELALRHSTMESEIKVLRLRLNKARNTMYSGPYV